MALTASVRPTRAAAKTLVGETLDDTDEKEGDTDDDQAGAETGVETSEPAGGKNTKAKGGVKDGSQAGRRKKTKDHANYCRLKIKNRNSKANGRGFGRRR
jgi:DNA replication regulator SLD2